MSVIVFKISSIPTKTYLNTTIKTAALLGSRGLYKTVVQIEKCFLWNDSSVALAWISDQQGSWSWKTFIANYVAEIHDQTANHQWLNVKVNDSPAGIISRGMSAKQLIENHLWFHGPNWLTELEGIRLNPKMPKTEEPIPERRAIQISLITINEDAILNKFSFPN